MWNDGDTIYSQYNRVGNINSEWRSTAGINIVAL